MILVVVRKKRVNTVSLSRILDLYLGPACVNVTLSGAKRQHEVPGTEILSYFTNSPAVNTFLKRYTCSLVVRTKVVRFSHKSGTKKYKKFPSRAKFAANLCNDRPETKS